MMNIAVVAFALFACVVAQPGGGGANLDRIFNQYAGTDNQLTNAELNRFWLHFDDDGDGEVSKSEFDRSWRQENFPNPQNAPLFFLELDRVADEVLNSQDFPHIFRLWDENGDGFITEREFRFNWNAYFDD
uniref:DEC-3 n=1 Tax=Lymnaea stagnalis TaxID=6523 RepID=Q75R50_LYMST|nr:DEC-3 [Lymnaea stagnalis]